MRFLGESVKKLDNFGRKKAIVIIILGKWLGIGIILERFL